MSFEPITVEKDGYARVAGSPAELVRLQWNGWRPAGSEEKADVVALTAPYEPAERSAAEVVAYLEDADDAEKTRVADLELQSDHPRKTVLRAAGVNVD